VIAAPRAAALAVLTTWLAVTAADLHSVANFSRTTVVVFALALPVLLVVLARTRGTGFGPLPPATVALALVGVAVVVERVRFYTYLPYAQRELSIHLVAGTALVAALLWLVGRRFSRTTAVVLAATCLVATTWISVRYDPAPRIDVWYSLEAATRGLLDLRNPYELNWAGGPGDRDAFTYLPMTAVLLAPFEWVLGDVRWGLLAALLGSGWFLARLGEPNAAYDPRGAVLLLWLTPGQLAQTEQSWTEPLLLCLLLGTLWLLTTGRAAAAVVVLAVGLATKQHLSLLLPTLALWRPLGWRRAAVAAAGAGALCLPWLVWGPRDFLRDTVILLVDLPPLRLTNNLYVSAVRAGWTPPFWLTGLIVLGAIVGVAVAVRAEQPPLGRLALWLAVLMLTINLVNKQAFYNQFWFVAALLLVAMAVSSAPPAEEPQAPHPPRGGRQALTPVRAASAGRWRKRPVRVDLEAPRLFSCEAMSQDRHWPVRPIVILRRHGSSHGTRCLKISSSGGVRSTSHRDLGATISVVADARGAQTRYRADVRSEAQRRAARVQPGPAAGRILRRMST